MNTLIYKVDYCQEKMCSWSWTGTALMLLMATLQDLLHASHHHYSFHLSESLLFNTYWLWFIPVSAGLMQLLRKRDRFLSFPFPIIKGVLFVLIAFLLHSVLYSGLVFLLSSFFYPVSYGIGKTWSYTLANDLYKYILLYSTVGALYFKMELLPKKEKPVSEEENTSERRSAYVESIVVGTGRNYITVPVQDIEYITAERPYICICTKSKKHLHSESLKSIILRLDGTVFVQIHRSTIVNLRSVVSYKSRLNGDYDVLLKSQQEVRLSRNYVSAFKASLGNLSPS